MSDLEAIKAKAARGERLTSEERQELMIDLSDRSADDLLVEMNKARERNGAVVAYTQGNHNSISLAMRLLMATMHAISAAHGDKRQALEDRVAALEGQDERLRNYVTCLESRIKQIEKKSPAGGRHRPAGPRQR